MKQTTNYQLSQWDPGDRLLRTDFNGDNGKIDAAIKAVQDAATAAIAKVEAANCYFKLFETTTTAVASQIDIDVSGIHFTDYYKIELFICPAGTPAGTLRVRVNGSTSYTALSISGDGSTNAPLAKEELALLYSQVSGVLLFYPPAANVNVCCVNFTRNTNNYVGRQLQAKFVNWDSLTQFNLIANTFPVGTKICICGVKK